MRPEAQRMAIAEACGWRKVDQPKDLGFGVMARPKCWYFLHQLPDYPADLNAMHEAEKVLTRQQQWDYLYALGIEDHEAPPCPLAFDPDSVRLAIFATAAQRAEAFLKTLNLWEDEQ